MLWSDPAEEPPEELRRAQAKLRRTGLIISVVLPLLMLLVAWRP